MADLKDLQNMAKNGELSEKLLNDENFKAEFKKIFKEECGTEIKDEEIPEAIKNIEKAFKDDAAFEKAAQGNLSEEEMEAVSGGRLTAGKVITGATTLVGAAASAALVNIGLGKAVDYQTNKRDEEIIKQADHVYDIESTSALLAKKLRNMKRGDIEKKAVDYGATPVAFVGGAAFGNKVGRLICDKCGIKY